MRQLSTNTKLLVGRLAARQPPSRWQKVLGRHDDEAVRTVQQIAAAGEAAAIPHLAACLFESNAVLANASARAIDDLLHHLRSPDYLWLDEYVRTSGYLLYTSCLGLLTPDRVTEEAQFGRSAPAAIGLVSCHSNGYVREAAVRQLTACDDGRELPFLLIRCNDWVPQVREAACAAVLKRLRADYAANLLRNIELVLRLDRCKRADHSELLQQVFTFLKSGDARDALQRGIADSDACVRRTSFRLALDSAHDSAQDLVMRGLASSDFIVRLTATRHAITAFDAPQLRALLTTLVCDKSLVVRRTALDALVTRFPGDGADALERALFDPHTAMRDIARFHLQRRDPARDFLAFYVRALGSATGARLQAAVAGIGETGRPEAASVLVGFCSHARPALRATAVKALACTAFDAHAETVFSALADTHPTVSRVAMLILQANLSAVSASRLREMSVSSQAAHVKRNILTLLALMHTWGAFPPILELCQDEDTQVAEHAQKKLKDWAHPSHLPAGTLDELRDSAQALQRAEALLESSAVAQFRFMLKAAARQTKP